MKPLVGKLVPREHAIPIEGFRLLKRARITLFLVAFGRHRQTQRRRGSQSYQMQIPILGFPNLGLRDEHHKR